MPAASYELQVIFGAVFRRELTNRGLIIFTATVIALMIAAVPLAPVAVDLLRGVGDSGGESDGVAASFGYADPADVLDGARPWGDSPRRAESVEEGLRLVREGEIDTLFVIPPDYLEAGYIEEHWDVDNREGIFDFNEDAESAFRQFLRDALTDGAELPPAFERALDTGSFVVRDIGAEPGGVESSGVAGAVAEFLAMLLFAVALLVAVLTGGAAGMQTIAEEKETRMFELLITSASPMSIMGGKLAGISLAGLLHLAAIMLAGAALLPRAFSAVSPGLGVSLSAGSLALAAACFTLGYVLFTALAMAIGAIVNTTAEGQRQTGLLSLLVGFPVYLTGILIGFPDWIGFKVATFIPFFAPTMLMMRRGAGGDLPATEIAVSLSLVAATTALMVWMASRLFSVSVLLAGQRITSPRSLIAALRSKE